MTRDSKRQLPEVLARLRRLTPKWHVNLVVSELGEVTPGCRYRSTLRYTAPDGVSVKIVHEAIDETWWATIEIEQRNGGERDMLFYGAYLDFSSGDNLAHYEMLRDYIYECTNALAREQATSIRDSRDRFFGP